MPYRPAREPGEKLEDYIAQWNSELAKAQRPRDEKLRQLARKLEPSEPDWPGYAVEALRIRVLDAVMEIAQLSKRESPKEVYRRIAKEHAHARGTAADLCMDSQSYYAAQTASVAWRGASAFAKAALGIGRDRGGAPAGSLGNKPKPETRHIEDLLTFVRNVTGRPHHAVLAEMLTVAGRSTSTASLQRLDSNLRRRQKKIC